MCVVGIAERIAIPVVRDRSPKATTRCAVRLARRSGAGIEFVAASTPDGRDRAEALLRRRCDEATTSGAPATWRLLDAGDLDSYLSWSGAWCQCLGSSHRPRPATIPVLVVGRTCQAPTGDFRRVVAGVDSTPGQAEHIAAVGASLADRIGAELTLIEVVGGGTPSIDVPPSAHVSHVASALGAPSRLFDTVAGGTARRRAAAPARPVDDRRRRCRAIREWGRPPAGPPGAVPRPGGPRRSQLVERVALLWVGGVVAPAEPRHPLLRRPVGEAVLVDLLAGLALDGVVADRRGRVECLAQLALVELRPLVGVASPGAGQAVGLQLEGDGVAVGVGRVLLLELVDLGC